MRSTSTELRAARPLVLLLWGLGLAACPQEQRPRPCRDHAECASHVCSLDVCAECGRDADCDAGQLCVAGSCTVCARDADCLLGGDDSAAWTPAPPDVTKPTDGVRALALRQ